MRFNYKKMNYLSNLNNNYLNRDDALDRSAWFVVYTKPRQERIAVENLARQNFEAYCPIIAVTKRRNYQLVSVIEPFFPRYIFVRFDLKSDNLAPIRSTRGVSSLVRFGGVPKRVPPLLIRALKSNENAQQLHCIVSRAWRRGDEVEIEHGPFSGYSCIFDAERSADRVTVLLNIVGKQTRATIARQDLRIPQSI